MSTFTLATAEQLLADSEVNEFAVDFDAAWEWLEYSNKANAWQSFQNAGFLEQTDFMVNHEFTGARQKRVVHLTVDCFKQWAMMSGTSKGKQVRLYFIQCERKLKQLTQPKDSLELIIAQAESIAMLARAANEQRLMMQKHRELLEAHEEAIDDIRSHTIGHEGYYTLAAFVNTYGINMSSRDWKQTGKRLTAMSKKLGKLVKQIPDVKYGCINAYDESVLKQWFVGEC